MLVDGARWGLPGAEAVLKLQALDDNGGLDEYWDFHLAREHQRLCPASSQAECEINPDHRKSRRMNRSSS
ncbi:hypothetical protein ACFV6E_37505 [Streptomyces sp. NPDC059785]|uniref:hypothetical protein n=1 Tax=Streptomyces sp. NPDC059785 TaxID=3346945 RepID=UPI003656B8A4